MKQIKLNGKYGFGTKSKLILPAIYEDASDFHNGYAVVKVNGRCGLINEKGEFVISNEYADLTPLAGDYFAVRKNIDGDWSVGVINIQSEVIVDYKYKYITVDIHATHYFKCYKKAKSQIVIPNSWFDWSDCKQYSYSDLSECEYCDADGQFVTSMDVEEGSLDHLIVKNNKSEVGLIDNAGKVCIAFGKYETMKFCSSNTIIASLLDEEKNTLYGIVNQNDEIIIDFTTKNIVFDKGFFLVKDESQSCTWYNLKGERVYDGHAEALSMDFLCAYKNGRYGVLNQEGKHIINYLYNAIELQDDCFAVLQNSKMGILGKSGELVVDAFYDSIESVIITNDPYNIGHYIPNEYSSDGTAFSGYCKEYMFDTDESIDNCQKADKLYRAKLVVKQHSYGDCVSYSIKASRLLLDISKPLILSHDNCKELFLHSEGLLSNSRYDDIEQITTICFVVRQADKYGIYRIDTQNLIIPCEYDRIVFEGGHTVLLCKNGKWGAQDLLLQTNVFHKIFKVSIAFEYEELEIMNDAQTLFGAKKHYVPLLSNEDKYNYVIVKKDGTEYDKLDEMKLEEQFTIFDSNHILTKKNNKYGFVSLDGFNTIPFIFDEVNKRNDGFFNVRIDNRWGVVDIDGRELVSIKYNVPIGLRLHDTYQASEQITSANIVTSSIGNRNGIIDCMGKEIVPTVFRFLKICEEGGFFYSYDGEEDEYHSNFFAENWYATWGYMNAQGKIVVDAKYDCFKVHDGFIEAGRDGNFVGPEDNNDYKRHDNYTGVYDLYTMEGELLIGGFREMIYDERQELFAFFFGGKWERYCSYSDDWNGLYDYDWRFTYLNDLWLILDKDLNTIMRNTDGTQHHFAKGFIGRIDIRKEDNKVSHVYNMPIHLMAKGFYAFGNNCTIIRNSNYDSCASKAILETTTGKLSECFKYIRQISTHQFFFGKDRKCGITTVTSEILPAEYQMFTSPIKGFFFAAKDLSDSDSQLTLRNISNPSNVIAIAINTISTKDLIRNARWGRYKIEVGNSGSIADIKVPFLNSFDDSFQSLISQEETQFVCEKWKDNYIFSADWRFDSEDNGDSYDNDDYDYMKDSWDAMTDGMYGDMPDGFDGDYDFLGR